MAMPATHALAVTKRCAPRGAPTGTPRGDGACPALIAVDRHDIRRRAVESFIAGRFHHAYGARIDHFLPCLLALLGPDGSIRSAAGFGAAAAGGGLVLERYLPQPIEAMFALRAMQPVARADVVEVGNLASATPGATRQFVRALTALLVQRRFEWVAFTATRQVRNAIARCGLLGYELGQATAGAPGVDRAVWGTYYDNDPRVIGGSLPVAAAALGVDGPQPLARRVPG